MAAPPPVAAVRLRWHQAAVRMTTSCSGTEQTGSCAAGTKQPYFHVGDYGGELATGQRAGHPSVGRGVDESSSNTVITPTQSRPLWRIRGTPPLNKGALLQLRF